MYEGPRTRVVQPCGKLSKYKKWEYPNEILKYSPCPETQNNDFWFKGVEVMVCGLEHSGSQPFI